MDYWKTYLTREQLRRFFYELSLSPSRGRFYMVRRKYRRLAEKRRARA